MLNAARKVAILGGAGCAGAHAELIRVADRLQAPIVHAMRGKEFIEYDNPYDVGMTGLLGFSSGYHAMMDCDALLMLGTDFPYQQFYPKDAKSRAGGCAGEQIGRRTRVDLGLVGHVKETLQALTPLLDPTKTDHAFLDNALNTTRSTRKDLDDLATGDPDESRSIRNMSPSGERARVGRRHLDLRCRLAHRLGGALSEDERQASSVGFILHGSMANAFPQAIGAQAASPDRQVISLSGDGGLAMLLGDLLTLKQPTCRSRWWCSTTARLGFVELEMKAAGLASLRDRPGQPGLREAGRIRGHSRHPRRGSGGPSAGSRDRLRARRPGLVDVVVNRQELSMPPTITPEQAVGFSLYMIRAVLSGRGDEVIDLAKTNLFSR